MAKSYSFYDDDSSNVEPVAYGDWGSYEGWGDALSAIYDHYTPSDARDTWSETLYAAGEYDAWAAYLDEYHDVEIDMAEFWEDFREAYNSV